MAALGPRDASFGAASRSAASRISGFPLVTIVALLTLSVGIGQVLPAIVTSPLEVAAPEWQDQRPGNSKGIHLEEVDKAVKYFEDGKYEECLELLAAARKRRPDFPPPRLVLARFCLSAKRTQEGRQILEAAAAEEPEYPGVYLDLGYASLSDGRMSDARLNFEKTLSLAESGKFPDRMRRRFMVKARGGLAAAAEARKDWASAKTHLAAWLAIEPNNGPARHQLGQALFALGETKEAYEQLSLAAKKDSSLDPAPVSMGWLYSKAGDRAKATEWMERAVKIAPQDARCQIAMATWKLQQDEPQQAQTYAEAAAKLGDDSKNLRLLRAMISRQLKDYAQAERYFEAIHEDDPGNFDATDQLAFVLAEQPLDAKRRRAAQLAEMNVRLNPKSVQALSTLGWVYYRQGKLKDAEQMLRAAVADDGTASAETAYYLAHVLYDSGDQQTARNLLKAALQTPGSFLFRKEAQAWLDKLSKNDK